MRCAAVLVATCLFACATVREERGLAGGTRATARVPGALLHRFVPTASAIAGGGGARVLVVPELGVDAALIEPLCERLQARGFDVLSVEPDPSPESFAAWELAVARAAREAGGRPKVLAIGLGGEAAWTLARAGGASGVVAVNVPLQHRVGNVALADALAADLFAPLAWARKGRGRLLLGGGRATPEEEAETLRSEAVPLAPAMQREVALLLSRRAPIDLPEVPVRVLASVKDNLVQPEDVLAPASGGFRPASARRLGRVEFFARDYGHLDWLASARALDDVAPVIADELEALP